MVFFSHASIASVTMLPQGTKFTKEYFRTEGISALEKEKYKKRHKRGLGGTFIHIDNARPHLIDDTFEKNLPDFLILLIAMTWHHITSIF
jgi:hypothetical protein